MSFEQRPGTSRTFEACAAVAGREGPPRASCVASKDRGQLLGGFLGSRETRGVHDKLTVVAAKGTPGQYGDDDCAIHPEGP